MEHCTHKLLRPDEWSDIWLINTHIQILNNMKKYIGTKQVSAEPMLLGEFIKQTGRNPYVNDPVVHDNSEEGYVVEYEDGYKSWSPKEVFEKAYKCAETFLDRLKIEHEELMRRFEKCATFVDSETFREEMRKTYKDYLKDYPAFLLSLQRELMGRYLQTLECRISLTEPSAWGTTISRMSFGIAVEALKFGLAIRRQGWNGRGLFVVKQVPSHIGGDIIPKMQSLPQPAKDLIMKGKGFVDYTSQCLIYNENTGRADSWVPSISDVFAEDWEIVL